MKNLMLLIGVFSILSFTACGQAGKAVPEKVKTAFSEKFPDATKVKWDKENETEWEAEFKMNSKEYSANFNADGTWVETEYELKLKDLPLAVTSKLKSDFADYKVDEAEVTETVEGTVYEIQLKKGKEEMEVAIDASGTLVKKESKSDEDNEDGEEDDD